MLGLGLGIPTIATLGQGVVGPYPAPAGYNWQYVTEDGVRVTEDGVYIIELEKIQ